MDQTRGEKMQKLEYNGWYNYETWNFKLWLDNDQTLNEWLQSTIESCCHSLSDRDRIKSIDRLANILLQYAWNNMPELDASFYVDVMSASIREVNFREIAESYVDEEIYRRKTA